MSFVLVGIAWSGISTTPYVLVGEIAPENESERYYSIFNFSTVIPQITASFLFVYLTETFFGGELMRDILTGGIFMCIASAISFFYYLRQNMNLR